MINERFDPWARGSRIKAVVGHYGSGKTEIALSMALQARSAGHEAMIVDMDIVNPFFRSAEKSAILRENGVELIAPPYALSGVDLPVLPAEVLSVFERPALHTVLDVGGEVAGAAALGRYKPQFDAHPCELFYVVNLFRPYSETAGQVIDLMARIERRGRLTVSGLINNSNLGEWTEPDNLFEGQEMLREVSKATGVPVVCVCAVEEIAEKLPKMDAPVLPIRRLLIPDWLKE